MEFAGGDALFCADGLRVDGHHHGGHAEVVVEAFRFLLDPLICEKLADGCEVVVFGNVMDAGCLFFPLAVESLGDRFHSPLVSAAVADEDDLLEAVRAEAGADVCEEGFVGFFGEADGPWVFHVQRRGIDVALGNEGDDGGDKSVTQLAGDRFGCAAKDDVVFAGDEIGAVLFDAAGGDDDGVGTCIHSVADFHPGEVFDEDRIDRLDGAGRIGIGSDGIGRSGGEQGDCSKRDDAGRGESSRK